MPELPEVETVRRGLSPAMEGAKLARLQLNRTDLRFPFPENLVAAVEGRQIIALGRRAKYLLIDLEDDLTIIAHLGMSGSFRVEEEALGTFHHPRSKDEKHDHVVFHLERGNETLKVIYNDPRRFGFLHLAKRSELDLYPAFAQLGPEPTGNALDAEYLGKRFSGKAQPLKSTLLDQTVIAGLGNIYVCEALWRAHLSPKRAAGSIVTPKGRPKKELVLLTEAIRAVIADAIAAGGSSLRDHIQTDGSLGYFQHSFSVYDQEDKPCRTPGCGGTVARITQAGRSTFYCPRCQK
ncbi:MULTISPECIES: bifunctional DNA-formamidopyrimidine glycosylase/DNA-(apurinic or apyrimidinic site) lyase [Rhizobium/Agrobacterium group]|jgi:formamidopyrimidine-DNA glycosylase|uniref:bifunctional DNA-formamidopyrimidine glycosylase/DNA-(apurinic or apyrimidinic site) lyase n=1 Tax=Rhizobium/Agrobacterium group TaxID=227290 RepID=UPI0007128471|nr:MULTISPECIES: bifunctional DNA-formamidopyrimidine glycosylase/DNA-(apurinic or apyrimidinic site) lyase [Rhizobium/Agrobacterium group]KQQ38425.1 5-hydroxymethyluracil DNA glycosylase [Rhizobium sp. Leaf306]MBP2463208.1 formamidopyrimidine-DNA glycosylase [Rhizobium sp. PvP014]MBP2530603.1 formamidopyrimidine-DNA glycosylase [Rhizobium sp. PvP099]NSY15975.1 bifunctional DNA-formamidopyrimidine glycosylase/DNA-(apurinic or apyrimidinic site) lyase [Neorhizobium sp. AL 9.2.2]